ncbi:MAG: zinc ribbon domain-containing protein [Clostridia bacterium]|nr:zinc ribbon domain-containing protein [Clostridia bacterium]
MKFCPNCHLTYDDSANVCGQCGGPLSVIPQQVQQQAAYDPTDHTAEFSPQDISDNKVFAMLPYLMSFIGVIIALLAAPSSPFTMFHIRQGLKISVTQILLGICAAVLAITFIVPIAAGICMIILLVVQIICFFRVCKGQAKEVPIIKNFGFLK